MDNLKHKSTNHHKNHTLCIILYICVEKCRQNYGEIMSETTVKVDRRVTRTKRAIKYAFAQLLGEKDINDITVSDIAEYADINRKTFYNYYAGVYAVVDEIENDIIERIDAALSESNMKAEINDPYIVFEKLTEVINTDMDFFGTLLSMNGNVSLVSKIIGLVKDKARAVLERTTEIDGKRLDTVLDFAISGMISVYQHWFNSDREESIEDISSVIGTVLLRGISGLEEENGTST